MHPRWSHFSSTHAGTGTLSLTSTLYRLSEERIPCGFKLVENCFADMERLLFVLGVGVDHHRQHLNFYERLRNPWL